MQSPKRRPYTREMQERDMEPNRTAKEMAKVVGCVVLVCACLLIARHFGFMK